MVDHAVTKAGIEPGILVGILAVVSIVSSLFEHAGMQTRVQAGIQAVHSVIGNGVDLQETAEIALLRGLAYSGEDWFHVPSQ